MQAWRRQATAAALAAAVAGCSAILATLAVQGGAWHRTTEHFADATDYDSVARGKQVYKSRCASCHGRYLQGQPLWQADDGYASRRAPAQDQTGHSWYHSDDDLFAKTKFGRFAEAAATPGSAMPAFRATLADRDIVSVIAFIKARWPVGMRVLQAMRNPDRAGMPAQTIDSGWTFPPGCPPANVSSKPRDGIQ